MRGRLLALLGLTIAASVSVSAATAGIVGCTYTAAPAHVCTYVDGYDTFVTHVGVVRSSTTICNYQALLKIQAPNGKLVDRSWSPLHRGCSSHHASFDWYPRRIYPDSSKVCTYFYESGALQGAACKKLPS